MLVIAATLRELVGVRGTTCGIGPVSAAASTAYEIAIHRPKAVLHVGLAGKRGFSEPEIVLGSESLYCDGDAPPLIENKLRPDSYLFERVRTALPDVLVCPIGTSARVGGTSGCNVEAMEGFAVLKACLIEGVPAVELRVTCNEISEPDRSLWRYDEGLALLAATLPPLLESLHA